MGEKSAAKNSVSEKLRVKSLSVKSIWSKSL